MDGGSRKVKPSIDYSCGYLTTPQVSVAKQADSRADNIHLRLGFGNTRSESHNER
jgi:hypothetical protein